MKKRGFHSLISLTCICVFITAGLNSYAQQTAIFNIRNYGMENGLPSNGVKGLQWDEESDLLWIATEAGISKFNGQFFQNYTRNNSNPNDADRVLFMIKNWNGTIFSVDQNGRIFTVIRNRLLPYKNISANKEKEMNNIIRLIISEKSYHDKNAKTPAINFIPNFDKFLVNSDSSSYFIQNRNLYSFHSNQDQLKFIKTFSTDFLGAFLLNGQIFMLHENMELQRLESDRNKPIQTLTIKDSKGKIITNSSSKKFIIWETGMKNPILFCDSLAYLIRQSPKGLITELICDKIPTNALIEYAQYSEKRKLLFIGTNSKGIIVIRTQKIKALKNPRFDSKVRNAVYSQIELADGSILTNEGQVFGKRYFNASPLPIRGKFNFSVSITDDSLLWYSQGHKSLGKHILQNINLRTGLKTIYPKIQVSQLLHVVKNSHGVYISGNIGVGKLENDSVKILKNFPKDENSNTLTYDLKNLGDDQLLVAKCGGVYLYDIPEDHLQKIYADSEFCVRALWMYKGYVLWGTYGNGYFMMKDGKIKAMPRDRNNYLAYAHCFISDKNGFCWISTNNGLFKVLFTDLEAYFDERSDHVYYHYAGKNDGMEITELNGGCTPCAIQLKSGQLSFPTMDGLVWADPSLREETLPDGPLFLDKFNIDGTPLIKDSLEHIPYKAKLISFFPEYSSWSNPENVYLDYKLDDTKNWTALHLDLNGEIRLPNPGIGRHVIKIRKLNGFGYTNLSQIEIPFTIETPWYKKWWFYFSLAALISGLIALILRIRTNQLLTHQKKLEKLIDEKTYALKESYEQLEQNNNVKTRLISIISHDLVTPLKFLSMTGRRLANHHNQIKGAQLEEILGEMSKTSDELHQLSTNILNWIKYRNDNDWLQKQPIHLRSLIEEVSSVLGPVARQQQIEICNEVPADIHLQEYLDPLKVVLYNLLSNAIRYCENSKVVFRYFNESGKSVIAVSDQGAGMSPMIADKIMSGSYHFSMTGNEQKKGYGLGYMIIMDLISLMNASLKIETNPEKGTTVYIKLG